MNYKKVLVLAYFNTVQASYSYKEISRIFGLNIEQVEYTIDKLYEENYLILDGYYKLSTKGKAILEEYQLEELNFLEDSEEGSIFINTPISFDDIYIPIGFTKKFK